MAWRKQVDLGDWLHQYAIRRYDEFNDECPECHSHNIQQLRRVTGYLTGDYKSAFNKGKQAEVKARVKHAGNLE